MIFSYQAYILGALKKHLEETFLLRNQNRRDDFMQPKQRRCFFYAIRTEEMFLLRTKNICYYKYLL